MVRIAGSESDFPFPVVVCLGHAYPFSEVMFRIFTDRILLKLRVRFSGIKIPSLLFADYVVLFASSVTSTCTFLVEEPAKTAAPATR